jgi:hypothetical protein
VGLLCPVCIFLFIYYHFENETSRAFFRHQYFQASCN